MFYTAVVSSIYSCIHSRISPIFTYSYSGNVDPSALAYAPLTTALNKFGMCTETSGSLLVRYSSVVTDPTLVVDVEKQRKEQNMERQTRRTVDEIMATLRTSQHGNTLNSSGTFRSSLGSSRNLNASNSLMGTGQPRKSVEEILKGLRFRASAHPSQGPSVSVSVSGLTSAGAGSQSRPGGHSLEVRSTGASESSEEKTMPRSLAAALSSKELDLKAQNEAIELAHRRAKENQSKRSSDSGKEGAGDGAGDGGRSGGGGSSSNADATRGIAEISGRSGGSYRETSIKYS